TCLNMATKYSLSCLPLHRISFLTETCKMTNEQILAALSHVQEPDLGKDLVTLNMVKDIKIEGNKVSFTVVLTTPACPLEELIKNNCIKAVHTHVNADAQVLVNFSANTSTRREDNG